jgi:hypothetical protein
MGLRENDSGLNCHTHYGTTNIANIFTRPDANKTLLEPHFGSSAGGRKKGRRLELSLDKLLVLVLTFAGDKLT